MEKDKLEKSEDDSIYVEYALRIKSWMDKNEVREFPRFKYAVGEEREQPELSKVIEILGITYIVESKSEVSQYLINAREQKEYESKYPELQAVMQIVRQLDKDNIASYLEDAKKMKIWIDNNNRLPNQFSKDKEESKLRYSLYWIKRFLVKPYLKKTEEEKKNMRKSIQNL